MNLHKSTQIGVIILLVFQITIFSGCDQYEEFTNDPPEITTFTVPTEVEYGETIQLRIRAFDANDDTLTYIWDVSEGTLVGDTGPEVQWTAPKSLEEMVPSRVVTVSVYVRDGSEKDASKTATITVYSKPYRVAEALSGTYKLLSKSVHGEPIQVTGFLRLTPTTFTQEFQEGLEDIGQSVKQFVSGSYKLVRPFDQSTGTIHWFTHGDPRASVTYTWDGQFLALIFSADATQYIYNRVGATPDTLDAEDEPVDDGPEVEPADGDEEAEPVETDGKPIEVTDQTFKPRVLDSELPVVVEFGADWCPFCKQMKPIVEEVALEHRDTFIVGLLDIDDNRQTTEKYKVNGIPAYVIFQDGAEVARIVGVVPKEVFVQRILDALQ